MNLKTAKNKISSAVTVGYPAVVALLIFGIYTVYIDISVWVCFALSAIMLIASFFGKKECFFVGMIFFYPMAVSWSAVYFLTYVTLLPAWILSNVVFAVRFFLTPSFRKSFFKKGLLFYGVAFFALALVTNGLLFEEFVLGNLILGAIYALLALFLYHSSMALGDHTTYIQSSVVLLGILSALVARDGSFSIFVLLGIISLLWLTVKSKIRKKILLAAIPAVLLIFFIINIIINDFSFYFVRQAEALSDMSGAWLFGKGLSHALTDRVGIGTSAFVSVICVTGLFGLLALLTHLKHVLELAIRHFSLQKLLLILPTVIILFSVRMGSERMFSLMLLHILFASSAEHSLEASRHRQIDNVKPLREGRLPRVVFPYIEAGKGHITPTAAVCKVFKEKYGDVTEVVESHFYSETGNEDFLRTEKLFASAVRTQNKNHILSLLCRLGNFLAGDAFAQYVLMAMTRSGRRSVKPAKQHIEELDADVIFSTHWSVPFYISQSKKPHPYSIMFCPDVLSNGMFNVDCNLFLMPMEEGHRRVLRTRMYAGGNSSTVAFPIRSEAYQFLGKRDELREANGIPSDAFVVTLCDGGYGMANLEKTLGYLFKANQKMTLIALCGTNTELYQRLSNMETPENITLLPQPFTPKVLEFVALSDLFVGKSGANSMAEPAFFGVPIIVTKCITYIERHIKNYYVNDLCGALFIPSPKRAAKKIIEFAARPESLAPYKTALESFRELCGAEEIADLIYKSAVALKDRQV